MVSWLSLKLTKCVHNFLIFSFHKDLMHCPLGRITLPLLREADERSRRADPALRGLAEGRGGSRHPWKTVGSVHCTEPWRIHGAFETQASLLCGLVVCSPVREGAGQAGPPPRPPRLMDNKPALVHSSLNLQVQNGTRCADRYWKMFAYLRRWTGESQTGRTHFKKL